jgi:hypothetical protein
VAASHHDATLNNAASSYTTSVDSTAHQHHSHRQWHQLPALVAGAGGHGSGRAHLMLAQWAHGEPVGMQALHQWLQRAQGGVP